MSNKEILKKAIEKAVKNGYKYSQKAFDYFMEAERKTLSDYVFQEKLYYPIIFSRPFAKAFWGEKEYMAYYAGYNEWADATKKASKNAEYDDEQHNRMFLWQYHLQQMVLVEQPLKYLERYL